MDAVARGQPKLEPLQAWDCSFWQRLRCRYGLNERAISRLTNLGPAESLRRFVWTQHSRQFVMHRMIQASLRTRASDGARRIIKIVTDQQPSWLDPFCKRETTVVTEAETGAKGIQVQHVKGSEKTRYTTMQLWVAIVTVRDALLTIAQRQELAPDESRCNYDSLNYKVVEPKWFGVVVCLPGPSQTRVYMFACWNCGAM